MKLGAIYVNGWASAKSPHAAGVAIAFGRLLHPDGKQSEYVQTKALVQDSGPWGFEDLESVCRQAIERTWPAANRYATEILWPCEYDPEVRGRVWRGEYKPPSFEEWVEQQGSGS